MATSKRTNSSRLDLIEYKLDEVTVIAKDTKNILDGLAFVSQADFDSFKKEVKDLYITKQEVSPYKWVIATIGGAILVAMAASVGRFIINGGLS